MTTNTQTGNLIITFDSLETQVVRRALEKLGLNPAVGARNQQLVVEQ